MYRLPDGDRLVLPRTLARTEVIGRFAVSAPPELVVLDEGADEPEGGEIDDLTRDRLRFWGDFVDGLRFDDPEQPLPNVSRQGYLYLTLPVTGSSLWITVFRNVKQGRVGLFLSYHREALGERVATRMLDDVDAILRELGGTAAARTDKLGRRLIEDEHGVRSLTAPEPREVALRWLRVRCNDFIDALRPPVRSIMADIEEER